MVSRHAWRTSRGFVGALSAAFVLGLLAAVLLFPGSGRGQGTTPIETMTIPGDDSVIQSATTFLTTHTYRLVISGTMQRDSLRYDALYCWAGCGSTPQRGNEMQLGIGGTSWALDEFKNNGVRETIPYNDQNDHQYVIDNYVPPGNGNLYAKSDLIAGYPRFGQYTIQIFDLTPPPPTNTGGGGGGGTTPTNTTPTTNTGGTTLPGVNQPAPGLAVPFPGQPITTTQTGATVGVGGLNGSVVVGEGSKTKKRPSRAVIQDFLIECFLISDFPMLELSPDIDKDLTSTRIERFLKRKDAARLVFEFCLQMSITYLDAIGKAVVVKDARAAAAGGCNSRRLAFSVRKKKGAKSFKAKRVRTKQSKRTVRYTCLPNKDGKIRFKVDGRKKGGLKKQLGSKLNLGLIRPEKSDPVTGRVTLEYKKY